MLPFKVVLCATDLSQNSLPGVRHAAMLARASGGRVILLHVLPTPADLALPYVMGPPPVGPEIVKVADDLRRSAHDEMLQLAEREIGADIEWDLLLEQGQPASEIERVAKARRADLIVIGTHGRSGLAHVLLGSVAEKVIRRAPCAVLTLRSLPADTASASS